MAARSAWVTPYATRNSAKAAFNAAKFEELPPDFELVAPGVARGSLLAFDYRVLHAGNPCARHRPVAYFVVNTRDDAVDDAWNWAPERLLPEEE